MEKLNALLDAGLRVTFKGHDYVRVEVDGTSIWWGSKTLDDVFEIAKLRGYAE